MKISGKKIFITDVQEDPLTLRKSLSEALVFEMGAEVTAMLHYNSRSF